MGQDSKRYGHDKRSGTTYYIKQPYETKDAGDTRLESVKNEAAVTLYASMLQSDAWMNLSSGACKLYMYMKMQAYSRNKNKGLKKDDRLQEDEFFFNKALIKKVYPGLYTNMTTYYKQKQELIDNGFIEVVYHDNSPTEKDIYRLSYKWQAVPRVKKRPENKYYPRKGS